MSPISHQLSTWNPAGPFFLGDQYVLQILYVPNPSYPTSTTHLWLNLTFAGSAAPVDIPFLFANSVGTQLWAPTVNAFALGAPVYLTLAVFSPAETAQNTTIQFGDGTHNAYYNTTKPSQFSPTSLSTTISHTWGSGSVYTLTLTTSDGGSSRSITYQISETSDISINSTAPGLTLTAPSKMTGGVPSSFTATLSSIVGADSGSAVVTWKFGDGTSASGTHPSHAYFNPGVYTVICYATTPHGSTIVGWKQITVVDPGPVAVLRITPPAPQVATSVRFDGTLSYDNALGASDLGYFWQFGDGSAAGGFGNVSVVVLHAYHRYGTFTVNLTVTDGNGKSNTTSQRLTVAALTISASLPRSIVTTTGAYTTIAPKVVSPAGVDPFLNGTWNWADASNNPFPTVWDSYHWGVIGGHTFMYPGKYLINVSLSDPLASHSLTLWTNVTVMDAPPWLVVPYQGGIIYGENHSSLLVSYALGSYADLNHPTSLKWNFTWTFRVPNPSSTYSVKNPISFVNHTYNLIDGPFILAVNVTTPWTSAYQTWQNISTQLISNPDWDGDGLPNSYEMLVSHTNPGYPLTVGTPNDQGATGFGLTDYFAYTLGLGNLSADPDGDGLTTIQELTGSVTGFLSNPLDRNTAGDGLPDGQHFFTDQFVASQAVAFPASNPYGTTLSIAIPNVTYGGSYGGFNSSRLSVEFNVSSMSLLSGASLDVVSATGFTYPLSMPTTNIGTYFLLNMTPFGGPETTYTSMAFPEFQAFGTWTVQLTLPAGTIAGSLATAEITTSYWENPSLADPTFQGMLQGNTTTTAIYNCSAPSSEYFPYFNFNDFKIIDENYWPYTETYYKLSFMQGVPYVPGWSAAVATANNASGKCPTGTGAIVGHTASYLGDANFGISPWNAHAAGDKSLTNGMKALGSANYTLTAGKFEEYSPAGTMASAPTAANYPSDPLQTKSGIYPFTLPLNPTALSTAGDGIADSAAPDPLQPLGLKVTVTTAYDPNCYYLGVGSELVALTSVNTGPNGISQELFTNGVGSNSNGNCGYLNLGTSYDFNYDETYFLPLNNSESTWLVHFELYYSWSAWNFGTTASNLTYVDLSGSVQSSGVVNIPSGSSITGSVQVVPLPRDPVVMVYMNGELPNVPGFGPRYQGEQQFFVFNLNMGQSNVPAPFSPGMNVVLESRTAFENSSVNSSFASSPSSIPSSLSCMNGQNGNPAVTVTTRSSTGPASMAVVTSWTVDLSASTTTMQCGVTLLGLLEPKNATATIGSYTALTTVEVNRVGLVASALFLVPYLPCSGCNGQTGSAPTTTGSIIAGWNTLLVNALDSIPGDIVWIAENWNNLPGIIAGALAQLVWGALGPILQGFNALIQGVIAAFNWLYHAVLGLMEWILDQLVTIMSNAWSSMTSTIYNEEFCYDYSQGSLSSANFTLVDNKLSGTNAVNYTTCPTQLNDLTYFVESMIAIGVGITAGVLAANILLTAESFGTSVAIEDTNLQFAKEYIQKSLAGKLGHLTTFITVGSSLAVLGAIEDDTGIVGAVTGDLKLGATAANDVNSALSFFTDYELYQNALSGGAALTGPIALLVALDGTSFTVGGVSDQLGVVFPSPTTAEAETQLLFAILGIVLGAIALGYTMGLAFFAASTELFPLDAGEVVASIFSIAFSYQAAVNADATLH
ncbi:MAG: PKD domain-containing protein [Thermoplasmata archaeon]|nr:PKD domain-containing protein [Thermoplasmata archaeon]